MTVVWTTLWYFLKTSAKRFRGEFAWFYLLRLNHYWHRNLIDLPFQLSHHLTQCGKTQLSFIKNFVAFLGFLRFTITVGAFFTSRWSTLILLVNNSCSFPTARVEYLFNLPKYISTATKIGNFCWLHVGQPFPYYVRTFVIHTRVREFVPNSDPHS